MELPNTNTPTTQEPATVQAQTTTADPVVVSAPSVAKPKPQKSKAVVATSPPKRKGIIEIPEPAFKARVQREAAALVRQRTGVTLEEAERLIKAGGTQTTATGTADAAIEKLRQDNERLRKVADRLTRERAQEVKKLEKRLRAANDARVEAELGAEARMVGIVDPEYAVNLFARAVSSNPSLNPSEFFSGLKTTHPVLFSQPVAPAAPPTKVTVAPTTTPPESTAAGEVRPAPTPAGSPPSALNAEDMSAQEFAVHQRRYGYVPGQA